jgi:hypothetical protein
MMDEQNAINKFRCYITALLTSDRGRLQSLVMLALSFMAEITSDNGLNLRDEQSPERTRAEKAIVCTLLSGLTKDSRRYYLDAQSRSNRLARAIRRRRPIRSHTHRMDGIFTASTTLAPSAMTILAF